MPEMPVREKDKGRNRYWMFKMLEKNMSDLFEGLRKGKIILTQFNESYYFDFVCEGCKKFDYEPVIFQQKNSNVQSMGL